MSQSPLFLDGSEVSTRSSRFVSDSRVVQIKGERGGITGSANRLSSVFPGRKLDGGTIRRTHTYPHPEHSGWQRVCRRSHSVHSADWHFESASNVLKLHVTFLRLISVSSHCARTCLCPHINIQSTSTHIHTQRLLLHPHTLAVWVYPSAFDRSKEAASHLQRSS